MKLNNTEINKILNDLRENLGSKHLLSQLGMIIKHLPMYTKIVKTHILQLQNVLALDKHDNKNIETVNLAPIVRQIIDIFKQLEEDDLDKLEELYFTATDWPKDKMLNNLIEAKVSDLV